MGLETTLPSFAPPPSDIALFRFALISEVRVRVLRGTSPGIAVREVAALDHVGLDGRPCRVSARSIQRWFAAWSAGGIAGLSPTPRGPWASHVLEPALVAFLVAEKQGDSRASVPELLRRATVAGLIGSPKEVCRETAWRALGRVGVQTSRAMACAKDQRRFAKESRLQMILCDGKHFRAGKQGLKRVAIFFIDDATRYILYVVVGPSESALLFLRGLHGVLLKFGKVDLVYDDHGSAFTAGDSHAVLGNLEIGFVHGTVSYPPGRGKIERFNRTAEEAILRDLVREEVDPDCMALELRLAHYVTHDYNREPHESLKGATPEERFVHDERPLRPYLDAEALRQKFFVRERRVASNDHVISFDSVHYEVPRGLAGARIEIARDVLDAAHLRIDHEGQSIRLHPVDVHANSRARRGKPAPATELTPPSVGAARRAAERALAPITQSDGGFPATDPEKEPSWK